MKSKYDEYNRRFFGNQLSQKIPIELEDTVKAGKKSGAYDFKPYYANHPDIPFPDMPHSFVEVGDAIIKPIRIWISKRKWKSRFQIENVLIHEMCHVYQIHRLLNSDWRSFLDDSKPNPYVNYEGHGEKFFDAADFCIHNSTDNFEGFEVTQFASADEYYERKKLRLKHRLYYKA